MKGKLIILGCMLISFIFSALQEELEMKEMKKDILEELRKETK